MQSNTKPEPRLEIVGFYGLDGGWRERIAQPGPDEVAARRACLNGEGERQGYANVEAVDELGDHD